MVHLCGAWALAFRPCADPTDIPLGNLKDGCSPRAQHPLGHHSDMQAAEKRREGSVSSGEQAQAMKFWAEASPGVLGGVVSTFSLSRVTTA